MDFTILILVLPLLSFLVLGLAGTKLKPGAAGAIGTVVLGAVTGALVVPIGADGRYGPAHALLATATGAVVALVAVRFTGRGTVATGQDDDVAVEVAEAGESAADGVPGAELLVLHRGGHLRSHLCQMRLDLVALKADDHHQVIGFDRTGGVDGVAEHRPSGQLVQHLRGGRLHSGAGPGRHDDDCRDARLVGSGHEYSQL